MSHLVGSFTLASIVLLILKGTYGSIVVSPLNAVSELNGQVTFHCEGNQYQGTWSLSKNGVSSQEVLIVRPPCALVPGFEAHYAVDTTGGPNVCNLIVANITMEQAGVYKCAEQDLVYALLTVTVMSPTVTYNKTLDVVAENDDVIITCSLDHNGAVAPASTLRPYFYWKNSDGENESISYNSTTENTAVSQITVKAGRKNITSFSCHAYLELHVNQPNTGYANNTPTFSKNASSPNIEVLYGPSKPSLTTKPNTITVNGVSCGISVINCSSDGNPAPNYRWRDSAENGILSTTNNLTLAEIHRNYSCEAYNTIRNEVYTESETQTISEDDCTSTGKCCVFPRDETTSVTVKGCDNGTLCDCSEGSSGIILTCNATTYPNASFMWTGPGLDVIYSPTLDRVKMNGTHHCVAYFNESLTNYTGDVKFPNGTNETTVGECSNPGPSTTPITHFTISTTSDDSSNNTNGHNDPEPDFPVGAIVGVVIGVLVIANVVATGLFFWYYKRIEESHSGKIERNNKLRLDRRFPWLKKMMPCVSDTKESTGSNCLWVSLFILLGIVTGIVTFPIWILLANKYEKNNETSALNRRENGEGSGRGENGRRPANISSSANHSQPPPTNQMNAIRREDPYQNESSRKKIELNNSVRSRNQLLSDSPPSRPPPAGRPPPPPNKPTMNNPGRSKDYTANDQTQHAANPEHTTYADLPFVPHNTLPTATPVQFLNVSNDTYAELNKT